MDLTLAASLCGSLLLNDTYICVVQMPGIVQRDFIFLPLFLSSSLTSFCYILPLLNYCFVLHTFENPGLKSWISRWLFYQSFRAVLQSFSTLAGIKTSNLILSISFITQHLIIRRCTFQAVTGVK
jgi:hypothetical protein